MKIKESFEEFVENVRRLRTFYDLATEEAELKEVYDKIIETPDPKYVNTYAMTGNKYNSTYTGSWKMSDPIKDINEMYKKFKPTIRLNHRRN